MSVAIPQEPCYYFECSAGRTRLSYFIPAGELRRLRRANKISAAAIDDFPDGIDLDCTEPDFASFEADYQYRPKHSAEALRNAFLAIFSSTAGWETFRGTGLIAADELESRIPEVARAVPEAVPEAASVAAEPEPAPADKRRRVERALVAMSVAGVVKGKTLDKQSLRRVRMSKGRKAEEVFLHLLQNRNTRSK